MINQWKNLQTRKRRSVRQVRCAICAATENIQIYHLFYRNIYDVQNSDLRLLCDRCHDTAHQLIAEGILRPQDYTSHHGLFGATKEKVKKRLGLTGRNMFRPA